MGQNNRARRAAKQRQRAQRQHTRSTQPGFAQPQPDDDHEVFAAGTARLLFARVLDDLASGRRSTSHLLDFQNVAERHQQAALDEVFTVVVGFLVDAGWTPLDIFEVTRRKTASEAITHLLDVVAEATARHPAHLVHPQWAAQLEQLGAVARPTAGRSPSAGWGERARLDWPVTLDLLLGVLGVVCGLPVVPAVLPAPGTRAGSVADADGVDAKILRRVRGLLAKAESTEHAEEADALTAKAQQLMTRYSIERAMAESSRPVAAVAVSRRLWLESPYVDAKALLVDVVASANSCRSVQSTALGFVAIVGHAGDLDVVELLVTSLLVQATRAMTRAGSQVNRYGTSQTRSFRQSFLVAYAGRIGERLRESAHTTETTFDAGVLVPVLTARREAVQETFTELFPELVERRISTSNAAGRGAGRAAADLARFDVHEAVNAG